MNELQCKKLNFIKKIYFQVSFLTRRRIKVYLKKKKNHIYASNQINVPFLYPMKTEKTDFLMFSRNMEMEHWLQIG